ncbi:hypothetical protein B0T22DRAFT_167616 [Podospora appendiculata]|uniref:Secreted protein n=1 Tax=Podospora appendiculata TaxID=314037 RepID=A0AAE0XAK6_9PEZI|nr:hypothetical protein B0T22DRAFT_167616 [Podospora appendiculata]
MTASSSPPPAVFLLPRTALALATLPVSSLDQHGSRHRPQARFRDVLTYVNEPYSVGRRRRWDVINRHCRQCPCFISSRKATGSSIDAGAWRART